MSPEIRYYWAVFLRRLPLFLVVSLGIAAAAFTLAVTLPTVFTAKATLLVESAQIPGDLAASTVQLNPNEQLEIVQQRLMTRANLIEIARKFDVYEDIADLNPDRIVRRMKRDTEFRSNSGRDTATVMQVQFFARTGRISAEVTNELLTRILSENARQRMRQAGATQDFFEQEVDRLGTELKLQSERILTFQNENADALPSSLSYRLNRQTLLQERLSQIARDRAALEEQRNRLVDVFDRTGGIGLKPKAEMSPQERELDSLNKELGASLTVYSETNPKVRILRARIASLETSIKESLSAQLVNSYGEEVTLLDLQMAEIDARVEFMDRETEEILAELEVLEDTIRRTPNNAVALEALQRDYQNVQLQYNQATERLSTAVTGERIEVLSKGQRITVIEQAVAPTESHSPNRPLIAGGGLALGLASGLGLIIFLEMVNRSIHRPIDLTRGLGITPLATVPYITTADERTRRTTILLIFALVVLAGIPAILFYVHYEVTPLDLLLDRTLNKLRY